MQLVYKIRVDGFLSGFRSGDRCQLTRAGSCLSKNPLYSKIGGPEGPLDRGGSGGACAFGADGRQISAENSREMGCGRQNVTFGGLR